MSKRGEKMQRDVLAVLREHDAPCSAYDVLRGLRIEHPKIAPPTVCNALAARTERGHAHHVESLRADIACQCVDHQQPSVLSICEDGGTVEGCVAPDLLVKVGSIVRKTGFSPSRHVSEVHGVCATCGAN